jgi:tRNA(Met) C34 N-acetyltransferase TmcA
VGREHCVTPLAEEGPQLVRQLAHRRKPPCESITWPVIDRASSVHTARDQASRVVRLAPAAEHGAVRNDDS